MAASGGKFLAVLVAVISVCHLPLENSVEAYIAVPGLERVVYAREGDINIGILTSIHANCHTRPSLVVNGVHVAEAIAYTIDKINNDPRILANISLGFVIQDYCLDALQALAESIYFAPEVTEEEKTCPKSCVNKRNESIGGGGLMNRQGKGRHYRVVGVVGPSTSRQAVMVSNFLGLFHIPVLGVFASSDELSDKSRYEFFSRLVPPDRFTSHGIAATLEHFGWSYVSLVYSEGPFGENGAKQVTKMLRNRGMCLAYSAMIPGNAEEVDIRLILTKLRSFTNARVVILFADQHMTPFFQLVLEMGWEEHFVWIGQFTTRSALAKAYAGSFYVSYPPAHYSDDFKETFLAKPYSDSNPWMKEFWEVKFKCHWNDSVADNHCANFSTIGTGDSVRFSTWYPRYIDGVMSFALALDSLISKECPYVSELKEGIAGCLEGRVILEHLRNVSFDGLAGRISFNKYGDLYGLLTVQQFDAKGKPRNIGTWDQENMELNISGPIDWKLIPESVCAKPCGPKQYYLQQELPCCWECKFCRENEIIVLNHTCAACPPFQWPDELEALLCEDIKPWQLPWSHPAVLTITALAALGIFGSVAMVLFFIRKKKVKLIKASSFGFSMLIMTGIAMSYGIIFVLLSVPSETVCFVNRFGFSLCVTIIYGPLLVKTIRIYRIFSCSRRGNQRPSLISSRSQAVFAAIILCLELVLSTIVMSLYPTEVGPFQPVLTKKYMELICYVPKEGLLVPFIFNAILICACAVFGFLTRHLPDNFNESWYLFIAVSTTLFLWLAFLPTYFAAFYAYHQTLLMCSVMLLTATIILCCLFVPKVYAVFYVDESQLKVLNPSATWPTPGTSNLTVPSVAMRTSPHRTGHC